MIQRIQSIYLFLSAVITAFIFIFPFAEYLKNGTTYVFDITGLVETAGTDFVFTAIPLFLLVVVCLVITILTIILYKNRILQARLCNLNILFYVILLAAIFFYSDMAEQELGTEGLTTKFKFGAIAPILSVVLTFLANRAIRKDEALVKSADRIR